MFPGSDSSCPVETCAERYDLGLLATSDDTWVLPPSASTPLEIWCDVDFAVPPIGIQTGADAQLIWSSIELGCPAGLQPFRYLSDEHVDVAMAWTAVDAQATYYLVNAFAGPDGVYCPTIADQHGWHEADGTWVSSSVDLTLVGLDISTNCNLSPERDPIPLHYLDGPSTTTGSSVLHQVSEDATSYPTLCTELDGWSP